MSFSLELLRRAVQRTASDRRNVYIASVTRVQKEQGEGLLQRFLTGANATPAREEWTLVYTPTTLPEAATPAWTKTSSGAATATATGTELIVSDPG